MASGNLFYALANGNLFRVGVDRRGAGRGAGPDRQARASTGSTGRPEACSSSRGEADTAGPTAAGAAHGNEHRVRLDRSRPGTPRRTRASPSRTGSTETGIRRRWDRSRAPPRRPCPSPTPASSRAAPTRYAVDAMDAVGNIGPMSDASDPITVLLPELDPPTQPGTPTGSSSTSSTIALSWAPSSDASLPITYRVYRDGDPQPVGIHDIDHLHGLGTRRGKHPHLRRRARRRPVERRTAQRSLAADHRADRDLRRRLLRRNFGELDGRHQHDHRRRQTALHPRRALAGRRRTRARSRSGPWERRTRACARASG